MYDYQQQAQAEMWDAIAAQDAVSVTYRVVESKSRETLKDGLPSLGHAQAWRDQWERRNRGRTAIADRSVN